MLGKSTRTAFIIMVMACFIMDGVSIGIASADTAGGIWLQSANSGSQAWAYYPYNTTNQANHFTGGAFSAVNNGTSWFRVVPGTAIYRKYIVINNEPNNDSVSFSIAGIPPGWGLTYTSYLPKVTGTNYGGSRQGYGSMVVTVPAGATAGTYAYTIKATSGTGYTSTLTDSIIVGGSPTSTPTPTPTPTPGNYNVSIAYRPASYNGVTGPLEQFNVTPGTAVLQGIYLANTGTRPDSYTISVAGIPASWYNIALEGSNYLGPGEGRNGTLAITPVTAGTYTVTVRATSNNDTSVSGSRAYTLNVVARPPDVGNLLYDPGFEGGYMNKSAWVGGKSSNYKNDQIIVTPAIAHGGSFSIVGAKNDYSRAAQNVTYGGHGFNFSAWFYVNISDPTGTSIWAGVLNADAGNRALIDNLTCARCVGYNNRTPGKYHAFQYMAQNSNQQSLSQVNRSGWYKGVITYDGYTMIFAQYDASGNLVSRFVNVEPGFIPKAVIVNAGSKGLYLDDLYYATW